MKRFFPKVLRVLANYWPHLAILGLTLIVAATNYTEGTYLTGWDNLHPEFNFGLNIQRSFDAVWQEYQGVGLLGGMAHASDLVRQVFLWILSNFMPDSFLRYFYHFLMLFVGMSGIYFLISHIIQPGTTKMQRQFAGLTGSIFYLLNLGTIQYFYVPFEPYSTFWGFFPWEVASLLLYLKTSSKRHLLYFIGINILATPQAYVQTIFLVYIISIATLLGGLFYAKKSKAYLRQIVTVCISIFVVNAFWLLPNLYFVLTNLSVTQDAIQNQMATEKFFQMNKNRGTIDNLVFLKEFYFDFFDFNDVTGKFEYMMSAWRAHYGTIFAYIAGIALFLGSMTGLLTTKKYRLPLLALLGVCLIIFLSNTFGISIINSLLRALPFVNQIFRNPFTKFIVPIVFLFAVGLGLFTAYAMSWLEKRNFSPLVAPLLGIGLILLTAFPVFQGKFISPTMRVAIPQEYFSLFKYFELQDKNERIMNLPQGGFWGWYYYKWGLRGSGFLWYGIEQPILDRAFDVWSKENENYYWELSLALQKRDLKMFNAILEKHQVGYVLYDSSLLFADNINSLRFAINQEDLLRNNPKVALDATFGDSIRVYKVNLAHKPVAHILGSTTPPSTSIMNGQTIDNDQLFLNNGMYQNSNTPDTLMPFDTLFTKRTTTERSFTVKEDGDFTNISVPIPKGDYTLALPSLGKDSAQIPVSIEAKEDNGEVTVRMKLIQPSFLIGDQEITPADKSIEVALGNEPSPQHRYILSINNNDYFALSDLPGEFISLGSSSLTNANNANSLRLYRADSPLTQDLPTALFNKAKYCGERASGASVSTDITADNLSLKAYDTANCTVYKTPLSLTDSSLVAVSFLYKSTSDEFPQYCIYSQNINGCLNKKDLKLKGFSRTSALFTDYFEANRPNDTLYFHAILEAQTDEDRNRAKKIEYSQIHLTSYPYLGGANFAVTQLQGAASVHEIQVEKGGTLTARILMPKDAGTYSDPIEANRFKESALNYDSSLPGSFSLKVKSDPKRLQANASDASSYILLRANNLSTQVGYLLKTTTTHKSGFPFVLNVFTNQEFRSHIYTYSPSAKSEKVSYFILPPLYPYDNGLSFLLGSNSYNDSLSSNELVSLSATPIPYEFLTQISLVRQGVRINRATPTTITAVKKSLSRYEVTPSKTTTFITLSQGYNRGWLAYHLKKPTTVNKLVPFLFATPLPHTKVNNWENGWTLSPNSEGEVIIIYLPQLLEYAGLLIFGLTGCILLYSYRKEVWAKIR